MIGRIAVEDSDRWVGDQVVAALHRALGDRLVAVVLFGSRARGDASADSDWDLLVIADGLPEKPLERHLYLKRLLPHDAVEVVSLLIRTREEFEAHVPSVYLDIAIDGMILYDSGRYVEGKLSALQRSINRLGLSRERTDEGDIWRFQQQPSGGWTLEWEK
jgi:predicted nucleotidyltransferase